VHSLTTHCPLDMRVQVWVTHPSFSPMVRGARQMRTALQGKTVVVVGRGSGIARAVALLARDEGARVIVAGAWDAFGAEGKRNYFDHISSRNPARRIGTSDDVADAVLFAMTNSFLTGVTLKIDGGEPLT
jgi:NAD(P)-dependent dehydrogenase (short-subunit alcohol dehydrogenase family)